MTATGITFRMAANGESLSIALPAVYPTGPKPPPLRLPGLDGAEEQCWQNFGEAATQLYAALNRQVADAHGLTLVDVMLLGLLANSPEGARMGELAEALAVIPSRVTEQVRRLQASGLVLRSKSPDDRRVVIASITCKGRVRLQPALITYARAVRRLYLNPLSRQQMTALGDSSRRIGAALKTSGVSSGKANCR